MQADQALFTSISRRGKAGYHLVAKSEGLKPSESAAIETWGPSHGALILDDRNFASVNFQQLPSGRFALSRTVEGKAEYSGRGGRQLFTQFLVFDVEVLKQSHYQPFSIYRDACALGYFCFQSDPPATLNAVGLSMIHPRPSPERWEALIRDYGHLAFEAAVFQVSVERPIVLAYKGDRALFAEALLGRLDPEKIQRLSFATNLHPSSTRPLTLQLVDA